MLTLGTDKNIDASVSYLKKIFPENIRKFTAIYLKYAQLSNAKFESLKTGEERLKVRNVKSFDSLKCLSFDKFIYALDKDLYIDFVNEISNVSRNNCCDCCCETEDWSKEEAEAMTGNPSIGFESLSYKFMIHPSNGLRKLVRSDRPDQVPLIKVEPSSFTLSTSKTVAPGRNSDMWYEKETGFIPSIRKIWLDMTVDIESLFEVINFLVYQEIRKPNNYNSGYDIQNIISKIAELEEDEKNRIINVVSEVLSKRLFYSGTTTLLATITKITNAKVDYFADISDNILNSCRNTLLDNFDSDGNDAGVNEGTILRNTAINIRDLLNSMAAWSKEGYSNCNTGLLVKNLVDYLFTLKYTTYNFIKVPLNNLKHKELEFIGKLSKLQTHALSQENAIDLNLAFEGGVAYNKTLDFKKQAFFFLPMETLKIDGLYSINKRMYDCGKDLLDCLAKFIILKKRMADTAEINVKDGTNVDRMGKSYDDYRTYLTKAYKEIKAKLNVLSERVLSITKGRSSFSFIDSNVGNTNDSKIKGINDVIYGLTAEAIPIETVNYWSDDYFLCNPSVDASLMDEDEKQNEKPWRNYVVSKVISDICEIFKYTNTKESKYLSNTSVGNDMGEVRFAKLIDSWLKFNQIIGVDIIDTPYRNMKANLTVILKDSFSYITTSISEMSPNVENVDPSLRFTNDNINEKKCFWNHDNPNNDETLKDDRSFYSLEDLESRVDEYEEFVEGREEEDDSGEENLFGMFNDFMGVPLGYDITSHELAMQAQEELDPSLLHNEKYVEERERFNKLKNRFDNILMNNF